MLQEKKSNFQLPDLKPVAIGSRLKSDNRILTLGFKPEFNDYDDEQKRIILNAPKLYYPTAFYAGFFQIMGKEIFPSVHTYSFALDKIRQTAIFNLLGIPHPHTRVFYGKKQKQTILDHFSFPFIVKKARGSARGDHVYIVKNKSDLEFHQGLNEPVYAQELLTDKKELRIVIIGEKIRIVYWRIPEQGQLKANLSLGGTISFDPVPQKALDLALHTAKSCGWNDVGLDIIISDETYYVIEANMKYGTKGFKAAGIDYKKLLADLILNKEI